MEKHKKILLGFVIVVAVITINILTTLITLKIVNAI